jgi:hypothetical protein
VSIHAEPGQTPEQLADRKRFLERLGEACEKTGWRMHVCARWRQAPLMVTILSRTP